MKLVINCWMIFGIFFKNKFGNLFMLISLKYIYFIDVLYFFFIFWLEGIVVLGYVVLICIVE